MNHAPSPPSIKAEMNDIVLSTLTGLWDQDFSKAITCLWQETSPQVPLAAIPPRFRYLLRVEVLSGQLATPITLW
jgi:hypothetical protein